MNSYDPWRPMLSSPPGEWPVVPAPYYGQPFISEVPSWVTPRDGARRQVFEGAFVGAELAAAPRSQLVKEVASVIAPATGPITAHVELDAAQRLHAKICVDGKCYEGEVDLGPAIAALMARFAQYHTDLHGQMEHAEPHARATVSGEAVLGAIDHAVAAAGQELVGRLVGRHVEVACSGWLSDLGSAIKSAAGSVAGGVSSTLSKLKGPIAAAAGIAAASGVAMIPGIGPLAAPLAAKLANDVVSSASGDSSAKKRLAVANQEAKRNPAVAAALAAAKKAAAQSTVAHHVQSTAEQAAAGSPAAQQKIASVVKDAEKGDPVAKAVSSLVESGFVKEMANRVQHSDWGARLWSRATGRGPAPEVKVPEIFDPSKWGGAAVSGWTDVGGPWVDIVGSAPWYTIIGDVPWYTIIGALPWYTIVGAAVDEHRGRAVRVAREKKGDVVGVSRTIDGQWFALAFGSLDDADDWFGAATRDPAGFAYAAYFDKKGRLFPQPEHEKLGGARVPSMTGPSFTRELATA